MAPVLVGVAGGSGSGKTTLSTAMAAGFADTQLSVLPLDAYYRDRGDLSAAERARINYDHPDSFDQDLLCEQLQSLREGRSVRRPVYDYATHSRLAAGVAVQPAPVIVLEGILVLALERILPLLDLKLYVDTDADLRFWRRLKRDTAERGRDMDSVVEQYMHTVRPMHQTFIETSSRHADLILPGEGNFGGALRVLRAWLSHVVVGSTT